MHRLRCGNPQVGPIFANSLGKPLNMNNVLGRMILPNLDRCESCRKVSAGHRDADHPFKRDMAGFPSGTAGTRHGEGLGATSTAWVCRTW